MCCNAIYLLINVNCNDISLQNIWNVKKYHYLCKRKVKTKLTRPLYSQCHRAALLNNPHGVANFVKAVCDTTRTR